VETLGGVVARSCGWQRWLVVGGFAAGSVATLVMWTRLAAERDRAMRHALDTTTVCVTARPTTAIAALVAAGLGCGVAMVVACLWRRRAGARGLMVAAVLGAVLIAVQAMTFGVVYSGDGSQQAGRGPWPTYCSEG
jgi:heme/copper-type cytochrome/quinol oxidase subunit 3